MCTNPVLLPNGNEVACHKCWQCIRRKVDDWTGRCIAESETSVMTRSVTLTYGRDNRIGSADHIKAACLTYSDVQKYVRSLRDQGYKVRYFVCGEYGSKKGRAHWHLILFFSGTKMPLRPMDRQFNDDNWEHGFSFWQKATPEAVAYVTKYIVKGASDDEKQYHQALSKAPPLGDEWFRQYAGKFVDQGLAPQDLFYSFEHVRDRDGRARVFVMSGVTAENFIGYFVDQWQARYKDHEPSSELVDKWYDLQARKGTPEAAKAVLAGEKVGLYKLRDSVTVEAFTGFTKKPNEYDLRSWMDPEQLVFNETLNVWCYLFEGGQSPWYWAKDPEGVWSWRGKIGASHPSPVKSYGNRRA